MAEKRYAIFDPEGNQVTYPTRPGLAAWLGFHKMANHFDLYKTMKDGCPFTEGYTCQEVD